MSGLVDEHPQVQEIDEQIADLDRQEAEYRDWFARQRQQHREALDEHHERVKEAVEKNKPAPASKPQESVTYEDFQRHVTALQGRRSALHEARLRAVAGVGSAVRQDARAAYEEAMRDAAAVRQTLLDVCARIKPLQSAVQECATAQNTLNAVDPHGGRQQIEQSAKLTPETLMAAAEHGTDLLETKPVRRLGLTGGPFHDGVPETAWEPPTAALPPDPGPGVQRR